MEAMSYGIPCIATDVGATSELVNEKNGFLLKSDFQIYELTECIIKTQSKNWVAKKEESYRHCSEFFSSIENYTKLAAFLKEKSK